MNCKCNLFCLISELKDVHGRLESVSAERVQLQSQVHQLSDQLKKQQKELAEKEIQLQATENVRRENEDLRLLTACQEQRVAQTLREKELDRTELTSLERILDLLHLREVMVTNTYFLIDTKIKHLLGHFCFLWLTFFYEILKFC